MGGKRVGDKRIVVNYNGELLQAQLRMQIMKHFIEEQERRQERQQMSEEGRLQEPEEDVRRMTKKYGRQEKQGETTKEMI